MKKTCLILGAVVAPFFAHAQLFDQEPGDHDGYYSSGLSTDGTDFPYQALGDNFSLGANSNVTSITFWGSSDNTVSPDLSNFSSFDIEIYSADFSTTFLATNATTASLNPTSDGFQNSTGGNEYSFTLATNLNLAAGSYWIAFGDVPVDGTPSADSFLWSDAQGDGLYAFNNFDGNGWQTASDTIDPFVDQAFRIDGTAAPEPASFALLGLGATALLRRKLRRA